MEKPFALSYSKEWTSWEALPEEMSHLIFSFLDFKAVIQSQQVNRAQRRLVTLELLLFVPKTWSRRSLKVDAIRFTVFLHPALEMILLLAEAPSTSVFHATPGMRTATQELKLPDLVGRIGQSLRIMSMNCFSLVYSMVYTHRFSLDISTRAEKY